MKGRKIRGSINIYFEMKVNHSKMQTQTNQITLSEHDVQDQSYEEGKIKTGSESRMWKNCQMNKDQVDEQ